MSCTAAEIAEKRRQAIERLKQRQKPSSTQPLQQKQSTTTATSPGSSKAFYGNALHEKAAKLSEYENKIKHSYNPHTPNRILSQPYTKRHEHTNNNSSRTKTPSSSANRVIISSSTACTLSMITEKRFRVTASAYNAKLIEVFQTIPTRSYDKAEQIWSFDLCDYDLVRDRVSCLNPEVTIGALPKFVLNLLKSEKKEIDLSCLQAIEPKVTSKLMEFQKYGVAFAIANSGRCMIADDMGLGKTIQAIAISDFFKDDWPLLICTTATARDGWERQIRDLLPWVPGQSIGCLTSSQDYVGDFKVLITSYSLMDKNCDRLLERNFGFIIFDESHSIKNFKAKSAQSAIRLGEKAKRIVLLSGTPALSRPAELFCQLNLIDKRFFGSFKEYSYRYCDGKLTSFGLDSSGQSNLSELNIILRRKFLIRRTKEDSDFEMGEKTRETILLDPNKVWNTKKNRLHETIENCKEFSVDVMKLKGTRRDEVLLRFYAETASLKADAVCSYVEDLVREKLKFIVFGHHKVMLNALSACMKKLNVDFIRIDGSTKNDLRATYIDRFQEKKSCQVAVLSLKACNAAITLTSASMVVFAELDWNPSTMAQCESRAHRIGQKSNVVCRYLLAKGTADDFIWEKLQKKQNVLNKAGIFSEDLSDATHSAAPIAGSEQITSYFNASGTSTKKTDENTAINKNNNLIETNQSEPMKTNCLDNSYKHMLDDDNEDAAFLELDF